MLAVETEQMENVQSADAKDAAIFLGRRNFGLETKASLANVLIENENSTAVERQMNVLRCGKLLSTDISMSRSQCIF